MLWSVELPLVSSRTGEFKSILNMFTTDRCNRLVASAMVSGVSRSVCKSFATYEEALSAWQSHCFVSHTHQPDDLVSVPLPAFTPKPETSTQAMPPGQTYRDQPAPSRATTPDSRDSSTISTGTTFISSGPASQEGVSSQRQRVSPTLQRPPRQPVLVHSATSATTHPIAEVLESKELLYVTYNLVYTSQCTVFSDR
jgi:hypothetical protein